MALGRYSVAVDQVLERVRFRLAGGAQGPNVAWNDGTTPLVVHPGSAKVTARDGWLLCNVDVNAPGAPPTTLQFLYFVGREGDGDDTVAAATVRAADANGTALAQSWGQPLSRVIWDGVLDVVEGVVNVAGKSNAGHALTLAGFFCTDGLLQVEVQAA